MREKPKCPECGSTYFIEQSSRELMQSEIHCCDCDYSIADNVDEDELLERWRFKDK